tara:strand:+ start:1689 stop:1925 length:237 start_codon:yes stop_codon:yes gene_type:complete
MDDLIIKVVVRLARVHEALGERAYKDAAHRALVGIGMATVEEAERQAMERGGASIVIPKSVIKFPLERARQPGEFEDE